MTRIWDVPGMHIKELFHSSLEPVRPALAHRQALVTVPGQVTCSGLAAAWLRGKANPHVQICELLLQGLTLLMPFRFSWD
ncbi:C-C Motif Chemokine 5 [Manis pentadactyla]|nr:C-C Motif Chemokine 5 [Manis pentadactyla]